MNDAAPNVTPLAPRLNLIHGEGPQLGAVPVKSIHSFDLCEDGKTVLVLARLVDGRIVAVNIEPNRPISACIVETVELY